MTKYTPPRGADGVPLTKGTVAVPADAATKVVLPSTNVGSRDPGLYGQFSRVLMVEDFRNPGVGVWNDGVGGATRDCEITFGGLPCLRLDTQGVNGSPPSPAAPTLSSVTPVAGGGTFAANTYFYKVSGVALHGEGLPSNEISAAVAANGHADLVWTAIDGYIGYNIYRGTATNTETLVAFVSGRGTVTYTDTGTATGAQAYLATTTAQNPGRTAVTGGVVVKRRIHDNFTDRFGMEFWFRLTSTNNTSGAFPTLSIYNRDGVSAWHGRIWLRPQGNNLPIDLMILDGDQTALVNATVLTGSGAAWRNVQTSLNQNSSGTHIYEPSTGRMDRAGGWHWCKLVVDFSTSKYVYAQIDGQPVVDLSAYALDKTTTAGFAGMHFSAEYCASTSTARYMHTSKWILTKESVL